MVDLQSTGLSGPLNLIREVRVRAVSVPLRRPVIAAIGKFEHWPLADIETSGGVVGCSYVSPYRAASVPQVVQTVRDLSELRLGHVVAPVAFDHNLTALNVVGLGGIILKQCHNGAKAANDAGDDGTDDLLVSNVSRTNEPPVWFVSEHLAATVLQRADSSNVTHGGLLGGDGD